MDQNGAKIKNTQNLSKFGTSDISNIPISIWMSKMIFIKYLPPASPILVPKLKMLRNYWNSAYLIFRISQSRFWCQRLFLLNIYHLLGPNWSQNQKYLEFIKIWHIGYFKYANLGFFVENVFFIKYLPIC